MLIDPDVMDSACENFDFKFRLEVDEGVDRVFSNFATGDLMRLSEEATLEEDGEDVETVYLLLNADKSHCNRLGDVQVWPVNVAVGNLKTKVLATRRGSKLAGYCPMLPMNDHTIGKYLTRVGIVSKDGNNFIYYSVFNTIYS